jgi:hypothetical protein
VRLFSPRLMGAQGMAQGIAKLRQAFCIAKHFARGDSYGTFAGPRLTIRIDVDLLEDGSATQCISTMKSVLFLVSLLRP